MDEKEFQSVFSPAIARQLIRDGFRVYDIKADKLDRSKTIFIFEATPAFCEAFALIRSDRAEKHVATALSDAGIELGVL